jgi:hypothetical protein
VTCVKIIWPRSTCTVCVKQTGNTRRVSPPGLFVWSAGHLYTVICKYVWTFRFVFWDVLPFKVIVDRRFRGTCCLHHRPDDGGSTYFWNVGRRLFYTAVHPRIQIWTSYSPPWELETSHVWAWQRPRVDGPALSPEKTPHDDSKCNSQTYDLKSGHESQKGARHQDRLADCKVTSFGLRLQRVYRDWNHLLTEEQSTPFAYVCRQEKPTFNPLNTKFV